MNWKPEIQWRNPESLTPYSRNSKTHPTEQIDKIAAQIAAVGFTQPIVIDKDGVIIVGHGRRAAALRLGLQEVPVVVADHLDEHQAMAYRIADNRVAESPWDTEMLKFDLGSLKLRDFDLKLTGFDLPELETLLPADLGQETAADGESKGEDEVPEPPQIVHSKSGDLWQLGRHRLMCGDSTVQADVEFLMAGEKADMVFTDPPYGMNLDTDYSKMVQKDGRTGNVFRPVIGDNQKFNPQVIFAQFDYVKEIFMWGADYYCQHLPEDGSWIVWDKRENEVTGSQVSEKMFGSMFELCWSKTKHKRDIARIMWAGGLGQGMSEERKGRNNSIDRCHPTQKPIMLAEWFFERWGKPEDRVVDLFGGSGSTLIACEKTSRSCRMMEIDPHYCDVILERWARFTGQDPIRQDGFKWSELKTNLNT